MDRKKLLIRLASLIFGIFLLNFIASKFYLYSSIWFFDILMHFLGGLWLGLAFMWIFWPINTSTKYLLKIAIGVLLIGVFWEIFEFIFYQYIGKIPFNAVDTVADIFFDLAGGLVAMFYVLKSIMPTSKINV